MNYTNAKDYLPLVQALAEGKVIQCQLDELLNWRDTASPDFTMAPECYRIKPEPREIWVNHYTDSAFDTGPYNSEGQAKRLANAGASQVRYREVIE